MGEKKPKDYQAGAQTLAIYKTPQRSRSSTKNIATIRCQTHGNPRQAQTLLTWIVGQQVSEERNVNTLLPAIVGNPCRLELHAPFVHRTVFNIDIILHETCNRISPQVSSLAGLASSPSLCASGDASPGHSNKWPNGASTKLTLPLTYKSI